MREPNIGAMAAEVAALLEARLGLKGRDLAARLARAGKAVPPPVLREATLLAEAEAMAPSPKLYRQLDLVRIVAAHRACLDHLVPLGVRERRIRGALRLAGSLAFALLVSLGLLITVLVWRGFV